MDKPFKTYEEQIEILQERGLIINDKDEAIKILQKCNYYNVINAYKDIFYASTSPERFHNGCTIEFIKLFMECDNLISHQLLPSLLSTETMLKSIIAYEFAKAYGPCGYFNKNSFDLSDNDRINQYGRLKIEINKTIKNVKASPSITHYYSKHHCVPIWVLVNSMTCGTIYNFYILLDINLKRIIASSVSACLNKNICEQELTNSFKIVYHARNACAHGDRMYCYKPKIQLSSDNSLLKELKNNNIPVNLNSLDTLIVVLYQLSDAKIFYNSLLIISQKIIEIIKMKEDLLSDIMMKHININSELLIFLCQKH